MQSGSSSSAIPGVAKPKLAEVIERIGCGPAQFRFCLTGGGVYLADGAELLLITAVTTAVAKVWSLSPFEKGMTVTNVFIGVLVGNILCGPLGDRYGRRQLIVWSYIGIFIFSVLSSLTASFGAFLVLRLLVGFSFGLGQPAWNALCTEITPAYWRIAMNGVSQSFFCIGELYSAALILADDPTLKALNWRRLLQLGAIPSVIFAVAAGVFLLPSPSFLALRGRHDEATAVLDIMRSDNHGESCTIATDFEVIPGANMEERTFGYQIKEIFGRNYRTGTIIVGMICFGLNLSYYGSLFAFPQILPELHGNGSAGVQLLIGALWEIPGTAAGVLFGMCMPRKPVIRLYLMLTAMCVLFFAIGASMRPSSFAHAVVNFGYYGIKAVTCMGYVVSYQYASEIFPTEVRASGTAFCIGVGRLGAMVGPLIFEAVQEYFGSWHGFFYAICGYCVVNCFLIELLPPEDLRLKDRILQDDETAHYESTAQDTRLAGCDPVDPNVDDGCTTQP